MPLEKQNCFNLSHQKLQQQQVKDSMKYTCTSGKKSCKFETNHQWTHQIEQNQNVNRTLSYQTLSNKTIIYNKLKNTTQDAATTSQQHLQCQQTSQETNIDPLNLFAFPIKGHSQNQ